MATTDIKFNLNSNYKICVLYPTTLAQLSLVN